MFSESGFSGLQEAKVEAVSGSGLAVWGRAGRGEWVERNEEEAERQ